MRATAYATTVRARFWRAFLFFDANAPNVNRLDPRTRFAAFILLIGLLACAVVFVARLRIENGTRRVEIAMDYNDFLSLAQSYDYNPAAFLVELRRAGLTSLALTEELGANVGGSNKALAIDGAALVAQAHLGGLSDPTLLSLVRANKVGADEVYLLVYDDATYARYREQLPLHFEAKSIRVLHATKPYVIALRSQIDYFNTTGLGIPSEQVALARHLALLIDPRFQNDERLSLPQVQREFLYTRAGNRLATVVFFGLRNQVMGFPDHIKDMAQLFNESPYGALNFGEIETYDPSQVQKGNAELAALISGRTVRVQAINKLELDKLSLPEVVARYELGVRERNVRVVYLRPFAHQYNGLSIEKSNVELVRELADDLKARGFRLGRAAPIPLYRGNNNILVGIATLAVPSIFVLLLGFYGWYRPLWAVLAFAGTVLLYLGGIASHHDLLARSIIALAGALLFATAAFSVLSRAFIQPPATSAGRQIRRSLGWTLIATGIALLGALVVVGIMSSPLVMEEVEPFRGVKLMYILPALIALALYLFTDRFDTQPRSARDTLAEPVRIYQLIAAAVVLGVGALVLLRSGNQSDISPSSFELALRHHLTSLLTVRPRFKEFLIGFPALMLLPALRVPHRRWLGVLLALAIGIGLGDVIDTFSHLHTELLVSVLRVFLGFVTGAIVGIVAILIYRAFAFRR
jgi:hypothetical protein